MIKASMISNTFFLCFFFNFSLILEIENRWFFDRFLDLKRNRRFCKNKRFASTGARFLRFRSIKNQKKNHKNSMQNKGKKMIGKFFQKYQFWDGFGKGFGKVLGRFGRVGKV